MSILHHPKSIFSLSSLFFLLFIESFFTEFLSGASLENSSLPRQKHIITFTSDNDAYFPPTDYDRFYSAGHRLDYTSKEMEDSFLRYIGLSFVSLQAFKENLDALSAFSLSLAQEIRVPNDKYATMFIPNDMPYSGYLYVNLSSINRINNFLEQTSLDIGLIGPLALAKQTQDSIHEALHLANLQGWGNQLHNEMIINLYYTAMYKLKIIDNIFDFIPRTTLALGNALTHIDFAFRARLGFGLNSDFGFSTARSDSHHISVFGDGIRIYLQCDFTERLVGHNIFLQGNTFGGVKTTLDINTEVRMLELGILLGYKTYSLAFSHIMRTKEFAGQNDIAKYGTSNYASIRFEMGF